MSRFEIHAGFFDTNTDADYGEYPYSSAITCFHTDDEEQARRIYENFLRYMPSPQHDTITGMYLHEKVMRYDGTYHPEITDHRIDLDWFIEDNELNEGKFFNVTIYNQMRNEERTNNTPRRHTTWADVKRWLDELPEEQLGMVAYVNLTNTSQWDGEHEITGLSPWDGDKPVGADNNLSFNIEED